MSVTAASSRVALAQALDARLKTLTWLTVYPGEVADKPPVIKVAGVPDKAGRVAPYAVYYPGDGDLDPHPNLEDTPGAGYVWDVQVTFVAGYLLDLQHTLDQALPLLHGWMPVVAGIDTGPMKPPIGYRTGPMRRDNDVSPPRFWLPTQWQLLVTNA